MNGALEGTVARSGAVNDSSFGGVLAGGGWGTLPSPAFEGRLDEIAIYGNRAQPPRESKPITPKASRRSPFRGRIAELSWTPFAAQLTSL